MSRPLSLLLVLGACGSPPSPAEAPPPRSAAPAPPTPPSYEVHEWGLVRRVFPDRVVVSGPRNLQAVPMPVAKPVLYFHRDGDGPLSIDVHVSMPSGHVAEHWPLTTRERAPRSIRWEGVALVEGSCRGARYPSASDAPCYALDFCEAAELANVETDDGDCVNVGGEPFDHLFYRGEVTSPPSFPLELALEGEVLRVTHRGREPIPGRLVRVRRSGAVVSVVDPPRPGGSVVLPTPATPNGVGAHALRGSLEAAGLTAAEAEAFARAWDEELFGTLTASVATIPPATVAAMPMGPSPDDALLYVLPPSHADALATLRFDPPPRAVRRAIVAWIDVALGRPVRR